MLLYIVQNCNYQGFQFFTFQISEFRLQRLSIIVSIIIIMIVSYVIIIIMNIILSIC